MPITKRKTDYNAASIMQEPLAAMYDFYGDLVDDRMPEDSEHHSLRDVTEEFNITVIR